MTDLSDYLDEVCIPKEGNKVYKEECIYSFDNPESEKGLYVSLKTFHGIGYKYLDQYSQKNKVHLFLNIKRNRIPKSDSGLPARKMSRLAIGIEGGFDPNAKPYELEQILNIVEVPGLVEYPIDSVNSKIKESVEGILSAQEASKVKELEDASGKWDGEILAVSTYGENLKQLDNGIKISGQSFKCERCDLTNNLWLNLTSGSIFCGRKNFDGSGGNNHAVDYYEETKYPLAVKLGTISKDGKADVYSYPEDNMVVDSKLKEHLLHFGIDPANMEKTDKSMIELEIDMNKRIGEWATLTESGSKLIQAYGPGKTGLQSLGNTCYLNSVVQVLFTIPSFGQYYLNAGYDVRKNADPFTADDNLDLQLCKLAHGLLSGKYSKEFSDEEEQNGIRPFFFKSVVGKGHPDFSGNNQQDAQEYFLHLLTVLERKSKLEFQGRILQFDVQDRIECGSSGAVKYMSRTEDYLPLPIPVASAVNKKEVDEYLERKKTNSKEEIVRPKILFSSCLNKFLEEEIVPDFYSTAVNQKTTAKKTMRLKTYPDFLFIQLKKFDLDANLVPYKLDVEVEMPDSIDLSSLRGHGLQSGETELKDPPPLVPDDGIVAQLTGMGFSVEGCKKAAFATKNSGIEQAMSWVMEHMYDPDFNSPFNPNPSKSGFTPSEESLASVMSMGFSMQRSKKALIETSGNVERAVEWIFSHPEEEMIVDGQNTSSSLTDGPPKYKLRAFISHMGTSHLVGHYVCHILKDDKWIIFNDNKVAYSEAPPKGLGYLYLYERE